MGISGQTSEQRQFQQTIDTLIQTVAQAPGEGSRRALLQKIEELSELMEAVRVQVVQFKEDRRNVAECIVNLEDAFKLIRAFTKAFAKRPAHEQREILNDVVRRIVVKEDCIAAEYYASPREDIFPGGSNPLFDVEKSEKRDSVAYQPGPKHSRTPVRTLSALVETVGEL